MAIFVESSHDYFNFNAILDENHWIIFKQEMPLSAV